VNGLQVIGIEKSFGKTRAVAGVSFDVGQEETVAVLGPSGCGKSTVLSIIAGLEQADRGEIYFNGARIDTVPTHKRSFGLMFQDFALFPHMNVFDNVAFGLRMSHIPELEVNAAVKQALELVRLPGFEQRDVNTLSGGEQQRVALARSVAPQPRLLMLDEPLGSLDRTLRERLLLELGEILANTRQTAIYVTHDQEEAFSLADRIVVMNAGRVEQIDTPQKIYRQPATPFVAQFLGLGNLLPGRVQSVDGHELINTEIGMLPAVDNARGEVLVLLRPDAVLLGDGGSFGLKGQLVRTSFRGNNCRATIRINGKDLSFDFPSNAYLPQPGSLVRLGFEAEDALQVFPA
jgi:ABC-type Fe3+/spermidine/putrescine transport system ATPase subunit